MDLEQAIKEKDELIEALTAKSEDLKGKLEVLAEGTDIALQRYAEAKKDAIDYKDLLEVTTTQLKKSVVTGGQIVRVC